MVSVPFTNPLAPSDISMPETVMAGAMDVSVTPATAMSLEGSAVKGTYAGAGSGCESVLCDPLSPAGSFTGFEARTPGSLLAGESLLDESFADAGVI